jgi:hypothetical protein
MNAHYAHRRSEEAGHVDVADRFRLLGTYQCLVVYADLAKAVRRESNLAVAYWWGVSPQTVTVWRKALNVPETTAGTSRLRSEYTKEPWAKESLAKARAKATDPARCEKIAASKRGKKRPPHVVAAIVNAHLGTHHSEETGAKMSATHRQRGALVPGTRVWTEEEDELVRTLPPAEVAEKTGRTLVAVRIRRRLLRR